MEQWTLRGCGERPNDYSAAMQGIVGNSREDAMQLLRHRSTTVHGSMLVTIRAAREADALLHLHVICDHPGCAMRTVTMFVKDFDNTMLAALERIGSPRCPLCGHPTVLEHVRTRQEAHAAANSAARFSVAAQMYERDHGGGSCPLNLSDDLPPTPPGWWER